MTTRNMAKNEEPDEKMRIKNGEMNRDYGV